MIVDDFILGKQPNIPRLYYITFKKKKLKNKKKAQNSGTDILVLLCNFCTFILSNNLKMIKELILVNASKLLFYILGKKSKRILLSIL